MTTENATDTEVTAIIEEAMDKAPADETPNARFVRLANYRMKTAIVRIRMMQNLGGPAYESTPDQVKFIIESLYDEVEALESTLLAKKDKKMPQL
jgi:hypothetical protein